MGIRRRGMAGYSIAYKMMSMIGFTLFCASLLAQESKSRQEIITKACNLDADKYGFMMKSPAVMSGLFKSLEDLGGDGNRKYLGNLLDTGCHYPDAKEYATKALKNMSGKARSRTFLQQ
jgi:hypothetical protein